MSMEMGFRKNKYSKQFIFDASDESEFETNSKIFFHSDSNSDFLVLREEKSTHFDKNELFIAFNNSGSKKYPSVYQVVKACIYPDQNSPITMLVADRRKKSFLKDLNKLDAIPNEKFFLSDGLLGFKSLDVMYLSFK